MARIVARNGLKPFRQDVPQDGKGNSTTLAEKIVTNSLNLNFSDFIPKFKRRSSPLSTVKALLSPLGDCSVTGTLEGRLKNTRLISEEGLLQSQLFNPYFGESTYISNKSI